MLFIFRRNEILVDADTGHLPDDTVCGPLGLDISAMQCVWPGNPDGGRTQHVDTGAQAPAGYAFKPLRGVMVALDKLAPIASRAFQMSEWVRTHRYCGVCTTPMVQSTAELCFHCPQCGFAAYPRISPAMMVLIKRGNHLLLAKHATYATARYTALAGFVEAGESLEDAIHREVMEEVGLQVTDLRYFGSQSWPFPHSLMVAFTAEYAGGNLRIQEDEIADARWFGPDDPLPEIPHTDSISGRLIRANLCPAQTAQLAV